MKLTEEQIARVKSLEDRKGRLTPGAVVEDAKRKDSPLHALFNWDKAAAAESWWLQVAREVIASVKLVVTTETAKLSTIVYVRDPDVPGDEQGYRSVQAMRRDPNAAREALIAELTRAAGYVGRCRSLAGPLGMEGEIDALMEQIVGIRASVELAKAS